MEDVTATLNGQPIRTRVLPVLPQEIDDFEREVERFRQGGWDPNEFTAFRLKQGVYGQRQPDVQMFRVKIPYGGLTAEQLEALGAIARDFSPLKKGHVTTRENMQFHFLPLERAAEAMRIIGQVGLTTREACGNTVRNVTGCPKAGVCTREPFDVTPYTAAFARYFLRHPVTQAMPRKFKVAFSGCDLDCAVTGIHDLGFIPRLKGKNGALRKGFTILTGGGTAIMPRVGYVLYDFVPVEEYLKVSEAVLRVFDRTEELRKNKARARLKFYIDRVGIDAFRQEVEEELRKPWAQRSFDPAPLLFVEDEEAEAPPVPISGNGHHVNGSAEYQAWLASNVEPQRQQGYYVVHVKLPLGDIRAEQFPALANIARRYAGGRARTDLQQNLVFRWVPGGSLHNLWQELKTIELAEEGRHQITDVVACPGTDSCKLGITSSMGLGQALREAAATLDLSDPLIRELHVKISGCPNGCGQHHIANIGLHGAAMKGQGGQVPAYEFFLAGQYQGELTRIGQRLRTKVPAKLVPEAFTRIIAHYQQHRQPSESFNQFVDRVGTEEFEALLAAYREVGPLNREHIGTYMDWGKTVLYKLERGEGECAI